MTVAPAPPAPELRSPSPRGLAKLIAIRTLELPSGTAWPTIRVTMDYLEGLGDPGIAPLREEINCLLDGSQPYA